MNEKHIIHMLEDAPLAGLTESEMTTARLHIESCVACRGAFEAAQLSTLVLKRRAAEIIEPSPFFQARVMAALRQRQASESVPVVWRLWKSAGALVASMALTTAALAVLSFLTPGPAGTGTAQETAALNMYSAEGVILGQDQNDDQMTYEQVLSAIYAEEDEAK